MHGPDEAHAVRSSWPCSPEAGRPAAEVRCLLCPVGSGSAEPYGQWTGALTVVATPAVTVTVATPGVHPPNDAITV